MSYTVDDYLHCSFYGALRGISVHTLIYPLEALKIRQQVNSGNVIHVAHQMFKLEGFKGCYSGLSSQLLKTTVKQIWCWPMIIGVPSYMKKQGYSSFYQQLCTGITIGFFDSVLTLHFEKDKILSVLGKKTPNYWGGWRAYWLKLSVNWTSFLLAQNHFKKQNPSITDLLWTALKVSIVVSFVSAPFDFQATLNMSQMHGKKMVFRGWPISAITLMIHSTASLYLINKLEKH